MTVLHNWVVPSAKTITISLTDADGLPVNFADHTTMQITATINKVEVKKFALAGDDFSDNEIAAVAGHADRCEIEFDEADTEDWQNGLLELQLYKIRPNMTDFELIAAYNIKQPAYT